MAVSKQERGRYDETKKVLEERTRKQQRRSAAVAHHLAGWLPWLGGRAGFAASCFRCCFFLS